MYELMQAHPMTLFTVMSAVLVTPFYVLCTYVFSGASARKGAIIGSGFLLWGAAMTWFCLAGVVQDMGPLGRLVVPVCWVLPSLVLFLWRDWFLSDPLSQHWLIGLQVWRVIGGVFLIEMAGRNIPGIFAYPAGLGDILVAVIATAVLIFHRARKEIAPAAVLLVLGLGIADFSSAFFFGFTSSEGPQQLFFPEIVNNSLMFPTGMIALFLVPYAIFFHTLSFLSLRQREEGS
ncbi:hypothetical protein HBA54_28140 [Pelagibius litoralis]|uniref:Uncharacterized protein n=1 Tax=Pelagibius litoralis TaxID=374515 RepID=A0A967KC22_9PROT|nr:hypothetical protein [Pelagibius litoralis]NIA72463.1 hypothetical protein [Pelagibius litoralis]